MEHVTRRALLIGGASGLAVMAAARGARAQAAPATAGPPDPKLIEDLVVANRILVDQGVVDGYGHVSVRSPINPNHFFLARHIPAGVVTAEDIIEYDLDCNPIDLRGRTQYTERPIHGAIYRRRPDVMWRIRWLTAVKYVSVLSG